MPQKMRPSPRYRGASGKRGGTTPGTSCSVSKNWTITKPKPMRDTAVRVHAIIVRSSAIRVRSHAKWLSEVSLTVKRPASSPAWGSLMVPSILCRAEGARGISAAADAVVKVRASAPMP